MTLQHFFHKHPLVLKEKDDESASLNSTIPCRLCVLSDITPPFYACNSCIYYYAHKSCAELPQYLFHSKHPSHTLALSFYVAYNCNSCDTHYTGYPTFTCRQCDFYLDIKCATMATITFQKLGPHTIQHSTHPHPMELKTYPNTAGEIALCFGCQSPMNYGSRVYACTKNELCKYFLHESCAELPKEIRYPFHMNHGPLILHIQNFRWLFNNDKCSLCNKTYTTFFTYKCSSDQCSFQLCLKCSTIAIRARKTIKYRYHEHLLCFASEVDMLIDNNNNQCSSYDSYCKQSTTISCSKEFSNTSSYTFYCLECNFKSHLLCGPLPFRIKYKYHIHPLNLSDFFIDEESPEEHYCDICEMERDPRIRVYCCVPCKFAAHVHCLIHKIINIFKGDLNNMPLKTMGEDLWIANEWDFASTNLEDEKAGKSHSTLIDLINSLPPHEKEILKRFHTWDDSSLSQSNHGEEEDVNWIIDIFSSKQAANKVLNNVFLHKLVEKPLEFKSTDLELKLVTVEGYEIPHTMAFVLKRLLHLYGDISSSPSNSRVIITSKEGKSIFYFLLCRVLKNMANTKIADVTTDVLREWIYNLVITRSCGFKIDFLVSHLRNEIMPAFYGVQAKRLEDEIPTMIRRQMEKLQQEMMKLESQLKFCEDFCNESSPKAKEVENCLAKASQWKWKNICQGLF
ncbi:uncharacterized protein LOC133783381 [Humulus lupulus]|uniref:uncharacterized protein LOC133783381 n=1 Tax=Humulus lupulus TaxID=3486 RepID=UPI002B411F61|nr:uncharacterized protein LOC133783381 [Humulus lupulus]XP_062078980.1 uncharacterized protein LOC133783381 [Humulus lupulus]XP_062078981.1 uncharacterized protein LOC133783381 [Humulus lupulus]